MLEEFPTVAELLALAVTAGEGPVGALERVVAVSGGALARELSRALADARAGATLVQALEGIAERTTLTPILRFVDGMVVAIERGTPLSEVLRAQAVDAREARKRQLLEAGGRKEIAMMLPVVFLVLPTTVVFAFIRVSSASRSSPTSGRIDVHQKFPPSALSHLGKEFHVFLCRAAVPARARITGLA